MYMCHASSKGLRMNHRLRGVMATISLVTIAACQTTQTPEISAPQVIQKAENTSALAAQTTSDPLTEYHEEWQSTIEGAANLEIYSQKIYRQLINAWEKAHAIYQMIEANPESANKRYSLFSSSTYAEKFADELQEVSQYYDELTALKPIADVVLADAMVEFGYLKEIGSEELFPDRFKALKNDYNQLFEYIADKKSNTAASKQIVFLHNARGLEVETILAKHIAPLTLKLQRLTSSGAKSTAPLSFELAQNELEIAIRQITNAPRDRDLILESTADATFQIAHLEHIVSEVQKLKSTPSNALENIILNFESQLLNISQAVDNSDFRDQPISTQSELIINQVEALKNNGSVAEQQEQFETLTEALNQANLQTNMLQEKSESDEEQLSLLKQQLILNASHIEQLNRELQRYQACTSELGSEPCHQTETELQADSPTSLETPPPAAIPSSISDESRSETPSQPSDTNSAVTESQNIDPNASQTISDEVDIKKTEDNSLVNELPATNNSSLVSPESSAEVKELTQEAPTTESSLLNEVQDSPKDQK